MLSTSFIPRAISNGFLTQNCTRVLPKNGLQNLNCKSLFSENRLCNLEHGVKSLKNHKVTLDAPSKGWLKYAIMGLGTLAYVSSDSVEKESVGMARIFNLHSMNFGGENVLNGRILIGRDFKGPENESMVAYDLKSKKVLWEKPLDKDWASCSSSSFGIALASRDNAVLQILNPQTGTIKNLIILPENPRDVFTGSQSLHLTSEGICFYLTSAGNLRIGDISQGRWENISVEKAPENTFRSHGDFISFEAPLSGWSQICDKDGKSQTFFGQAVWGFNKDHLCLVSSCHDNEDNFSSFHLIEELRAKGDFIQRCSRDPITSEWKPMEGVYIPNSWATRVRGISGDGKTCLVTSWNRQKPLRSENGIQSTEFGESPTSIYFINLENKTIKKIGTHPISMISHIHVDVKRMTVWAWDLEGTELWKHSEQSSERQGEIGKKGISNSFLGLDEDGRPLIESWKF